MAKKKTSTNKRRTTATKNKGRKKKPFSTMPSGFTQTAGTWSDTKPVTLRKLEKPLSYKGGTVAARKPKVSKGASKPNEHKSRKPKKGASKPNEHLHRKMRSGQPEISYNFPSAQAAEQLKAFEKTIANAIRNAQRR